MEHTFAVNVLAPFLLTELLRDTLAAAAPSRVVNVASGAHYSAHLRLSDLNGDEGWHGGKAYGSSKLALVVLTLEAAERLRPAGITVNALHPGVVRTKLLRAGWPYSAGVGRSVERGAAAVVHLASAADVAGVTGAYYTGTRRDKPSPLAADAELRRRLWDECVRLTGGLAADGAGGAPAPLAA